MGDYFDFKLIFDYLPELLSRLHITLILLITATIIGMSLGAVIALLRLYKIPVLNQISVVFISFMRGTPILVQMFIVYYGLPRVLLLIGLDINRWDKFIFVILTYGFNMAAFVAEIIRGAIISVPIGQTEAAYSAGLTRLQAFRRIVAPQALLSALPSLSVNVVYLLQDTSIAFSLGIIDVMGQAKVIGARTYHTLESYTGAAVIFLVLCIILEKGCSKMEKKLTERMIGDGR
ncbi:amino acid ABC transporter permease [Clostridium aminobutyricum]|uniref:Amino acid ABC transporter permease n=1 Tax=Clostridium aminobutyricum TaxID=33953 RepID=A0A939D703_CLOAM|nr:amino acid ABC transporter permease [Clostridium aminobutyricum]MBN7772231.1 amino acid ABC transporter permease [Clostridium aminobutyricum]